jgi:hypothetical protein
VLVLAAAASLAVQFAAVYSASPSSEVSILCRMKEAMNAQTRAAMLSGRAAKEPAMLYSWL